MSLPAVIGHRGACADAPENTLAALHAAAAAGARAVEVDLRLAADGTVVLMHDATVARTTNGRGRVAALDGAALAALDAGAWFGSAFAGARVPRLAEAIPVLVAHRLAVNLELKPVPGHAPALVAAVVATLAAAWPPDHAPPVLSSFSRVALRAARGRAPQLPRALLVRALPKGWRRAARALDCEGVHCDQRHLTAAEAAAVRAAGYALRCYTVNSPARAATLYGWGVDGLFTDAPRRLLPIAGRF